jgi:hypothetical protein
LAAVKVSFKGGGLTENETLIRILFIVIGRWSLAVKTRIIYLSKAALGVILQNHRQLPFCMHFQVENWVSKEGS